MTSAQYRQTESEHSLQVKVLRYLTENAAPDIHWIAIPNAGRRTLRTGARMKAEGLTAGAPDLCILLPGGKVLWMELKAPKGTQSDEQKGFQARCARLDHVYVVVRTFEEAVGKLRVWVKHKTIATIIEEYEQRTDNVKQRRQSI